jgi:hypothetical protein
MNKYLKMMIGFISLIAFVTSIMILISPLIFILSNWIIEADPNVLGVGLMVIGIIGIYFIFKNRE